MSLIQTNNSFLRGEQYQKRSSQKILSQCQKVIKQLQTELQLALQQNKQKDQIIKILTQQKQFYESQSKKNDDKIYPKLKQQLSFNQSLIKGLKQHNKDLTQKNIKLIQQNSDLWRKIQEKDQLLKIMEQKIQVIQKEKIQLEKQWSETLKCVKKKIFQIKKQSYSNQQNIHNKTQKNHKNQRRNYSKQNIRRNSIKQISKQKLMSTQLKVKQILKQIDQKLLNYEFLDMIQSQNLRQNVESCNIDEQNKQNINTQNYVKKLFQEQKVNKKIPILKLSQLCLKENYNGNQNNQN